MRSLVVQMTFKGAWESRQAELQEGQDRAAKRTIRQLEQKVCCALLKPWTLKSIGPFVRLLTAVDPPCEYLLKYLQV